MILKKEYREADEGQVGFGIMSVLTFIATVTFLAARLDPGQSAHSTAWNIALVGSGLPMIACVAGFIRCRRTIRAWRDQKRLKMIQDEMSNDGDS